MQLLALFFPDFDHFWQVEMDMRFTGDSGRYLDRMDHFARVEPRKQALERSTFQHMQRRIGDYQTFFRAVNATHAGAAHVWGPLRIPDIDPIGPEPPVKDPRRDRFHWGVGEDADLVVTSMCNNATLSTTWFSRTWLAGFRAGLDTPRFFCPPAITRTSRALLLAVHDAQLRLGLAVPSEATPVSYALWHGLKISFPQHPVFWVQGPDVDDATTDGWWKGGPANASATGVGPKSLVHPGGHGLSFWWESYWPRRIVDAWEGRTADGQGEAKLPWLLHQKDGKIYIPNMVLHPMKHHK